MELSPKFLFGVLCASVSLASFGVTLRGERELGLIITPSGADFGEVRQGDQLDFVGMITNNTDMLILLRRTPSSCSCTVVDGVAGRRLMPGDSVPLRAKWDVGANRGNVSTTILIEYDTVETAGVAESSFRPLRLNAFVKPDYSVPLERLVFDPSAGDSEVSLPFRSDPQLAVKLVSVTSNHLAFAPSIVGSVITVRFVASAWKSDTLLLPELRLRTNSVAAPELVLPITVK